MGTTETIHADLLHWLRAHEWEVQNGYMPKFHAVMGDPPYFLGSIVRRFGKEGAAPAKRGKDGSFGRLSKGFMGKSWDGFDSLESYQYWVSTWAELMLSFVHPGAVLAMSGGTRTYHRLANGLEDAGWEIFDSMLAWNYGSGFPKAADIGKQIDKAAGAERRVIGKAPGARNGNGNNADYGSYGSAEDGTYNVSAPSTDAAKRWEGYKTALKPAYEPIVLARAPRGKETYAGLALKYGTGALNIPGARIATEESLKAGGSLVTSPADERSGASLGMFQAGTPNLFKQDAGGRYPANLALVCSCEGYEHEPGCPVRVMDEQSGSSASAYKEPSARPRNNGIGLGSDEMRSGSSEAPDQYGDEGGASRFFYTAKSPSWEREAGLEAFAAVEVGDGREKPIDNAYQRGETARRNTHPTVKPIKLMEWLGSLLLPPPLDVPRRILVPFAGVASEMIGAYLAGWDEIVGIEREAEYIPINAARRQFWQGFSSYDEVKQFLGIPDILPPEKQGQMSIFDYLGEE